MTEKKMMMMMTMSIFLKRLEEKMKVMRMMNQRLECNLGAQNRFVGCVSGLVPAYILLPRNWGY